MQKQLNYSIEDRDSLKVVNLSGNLSLLTKDTFESIIQNASQRASVIVNMEGVSIVTSAGLNSLVGSSLDVKSRNYRMFLMKPRKDLLKMIELMETYEFFIIIDTIEEGQTKIKYYM